MQRLDHFELRHPLKSNVGLEQPTLPANTLNQACRLSLLLRHLAFAHFVNDLSLLAAYHLRRKIDIRGAARLALVQLSIEDAPSR